MDKSFTKSRLKTAAQALKPYVQKSSHRHELIANYFGFNSSIHLNQSEHGLVFDLDEPQSFESSAQNPEKRVESRMKDLGLEVRPDLTYQISKTIGGSVLPDCSCCEHNSGFTKLLNKEEMQFRRTPLHEMPDDYQQAALLIEEERRLEREFNKPEWICATCEDNPNIAAFCVLCGDGPFHPSVVNDQGLCPEHYDEWDFDEQEIEDQESFVEYAANHPL